MVNIISSSEFQTDIFYVCIEVRGQVFLFSCLTFMWLLEIKLGFPNTGSVMFPHLADPAMIVYIK